MFNLQKPEQKISFKNDQLYLKMIKYINKRQFVRLLGKYFNFEHYIIVNEPVLLKSLFKIKLTFDSDDIIDGIVIIGTSFFSTAFLSVKVTFLTSSMALCKSSGA